MTVKPEILYQRCVDGDEMAWNYVYNYLLAYLRQTGTPESDAQDLAQETIRYCLDRGLKFIRKPKAFKKVLRMKARALFLDQYRARKNRKELGEARLGEMGLDQFSDVTSASRGNPLEIRIFLSQALGIVRRSLAALDGECRRVLDIYFRARFLGVKMKEAAKEMALSPSAFRTKAHRCGQRLMGQPEYANLLVEYRRLGDEDSSA